MTTKIIRISTVTLLLFFVCFNLTAASDKNDDSEETPYKEILKEGREWVIEYHWSHIDFNRYDEDRGMDVIRIVGDTLIHGKTCRILEGKYGSSTYGRIRAFLFEENRELRYLYNLDDFKSFDENSLIVYSPDKKVTFDEQTDAIEVNGEILSRRHGHVRLIDLVSVEGIGHSSRLGIQSDHGLPVITGPSIIWYLVQVRDNGEVTFDRSDFFRGLEDKPFSEVSMVREDRVWVYGGKNADGSFYKSYYRFDPAVRSGIWDYHPFTEFRRETWMDPADASDFSVTDGDAIPDALVREQCGTVYMANPEQENKEYCLYMFNTPHLSYYPEWILNKDKAPGVGDEIYLPNMTFSTNYGDFLEFVFYIPGFRPVFGEMEIDGEKRLTYCYRMNGRNEPVAVEGIGITTMGTLPYNFHPDDLPEEGCPRLLEYRDADGKVIHKFADFSEVTGISGVAETDGNLSEDRRMFDLFGREIRDPQPGTIYVQDGRKFVAR